MEIISISILTISFIFIFFKFVNRNVCGITTIKKLLAKRGHSEDKLNEFFSWDLKALPNLTQMHDMDKAANRIITAINKYLFILLKAGCLFFDFGS